MIRNGVIRFVIKRVRMFDENQSENFFFSFNLYIHTTAAFFQTIRSRQTPFLRQVACASDVADRDLHGYMASEVCR